MRCGRIWPVLSRRASPQAPHPHIKADATFRLPFNLLCLHSPLDKTPECNSASKLPPSAIIGKTRQAPLPRADPQAGYPAPLTCPRPSAARLPRPCRCPGNPHPVSLRLREGRHGRIAHLPGKAARDRTNIDGGISSLAAGRAGGHRLMRSCSDGDESNAEPAQDTCNTHTHTHDGRTMEACKLLARRMSPQAQPGSPDQTIAPARHFRFNEPCMCECKQAPLEGRSARRARALTPQMTRWCPRGAASRAWRSLREQ